ncbi:MAG: hypothetical protein RL518_1332 [Pseudomonadota bacterium]
MGSMMKTCFTFLSFMLLAIAFSSTAEAELVCARVRTFKGAPKLVVVRTSKTSCPKGTELLVDTSKLAGPKGDTGPAGATGPAGSNGTDGDLNILCYARVDMDTDSVTVFGGNGTTGVVAAEGAHANDNIVTCNGSYPNVSSMSDLVVFAVQAVNSTGSPPGDAVIDLDGSSASTSQIVLRVKTADGDEHYNVLVLGPS